MSAALGLGLALPGIVLATFGLYLVVLAIASGARRASPPPRSGNPRRRLAVVVPAHDEEDLIERCVESLAGQSYPADLLRIVVVADNCSDATAVKAASAGASVLVRTDLALRGKGYALRWAMDQLLAEKSPPDAIAVVDADSVADRDLLLVLEAELDSSHDVVQADYALLEEPRIKRSEMARVGFLLFHRVRFSGRARLGMAANLVGNGMLFSKRVLKDHPWDAFTGVEDLEYSIRLRLAGIHPVFASGARILGPGPASGSGAVSQRLRWEGGRFHVVRRQLPNLVRAAVARRDIGLLDAALDLAVPPLSLLTIAISVGALLTAIATVARLAPAWAMLPWAVAMLAVPSFVVIGLWAARAPRSVWLVLLRSPSFVAWKAITYLRLMKGFDAGRWDRTERASEIGRRVPARIDIAGVPIDALDMAGARAHLHNASRGLSLTHVATVNLDFIVRAQTDPALRRVFLTSQFNLADGAPVVWLSRLLGAHLPGRVAGADLVPALMADLAKTGARVFLLGGEGGVAQDAATRLLEANPDLVIAGVYEPPRATIQEMDNVEILARITASRADVLLVALGHPKQELWIDAHRDELSVKLAIGVGCVFDLLAGRSQRAPSWMQRAGLEWAYRLAREPRRLLGRYATDAAWLVPIAAKVLRSRLAPRPLTEVA